MRLAVLGLLAALAPAGAAAGESVTYSVGSEEFEGYSARAAGEVKGLVLIVHDWDGLTGYERKRADMLADLGYDAFAVDLFGKGNRPVETDAKRAETGKLMQDRARMRSLLLGGLVEARRMIDAPVVAMGYCFGGTAALELARSGQAENVAGYASFHGGLTTPEGQSYPGSTPPLFIAHGGADSSVTMEHVAALSQELEAAEVSYQIEVYSGAPHGFTEFDSDRYRERADRKSWEEFQAFLAESLPSS